MKKIWFFPKNRSFIHSGSFEMKKVLIILLSGLCVSFAGYSQEKQTMYRAEAFGSVSTGTYTPFWMLYHNWGMVPLEGNNFYLRGGVFHQQEINKDWDFKLGVDIAGSSPHAYGTVWVQQAYGELNWKSIRLNIGAKEDYTSLLDEYLSSGDFSLSNNARPLPEIKGSLPDFILIPYTKGNMYIKGDFAIGKYLDGNWQEDVARPHNQSYEKDILSHHKSIYFRFGNIRKNRMQFTVGMDHQVQWGGDLYQWNAGAQQYDVQHQPEGLDDFFRVMIAKEGSSSSSGADSAYVAGSQCGSYLFRYDYLLKNNDQLSVYLHHFFDDGSGMVFENYRDMLLGVQYKTDRKALLSNAVFEYIYTKQQTGPIHFNITMDDAHSSIRSKGNGNDNYYNNVDYVQGRSYYGRTMGTPLFLSPEFNGDGRLEFKSSRIISFHLGIEGYFHSDLKYRLLATTGQTWGRYYVPYSSVREGFTSHMDLIYSTPKIKGLDLKLSVGFNTGTFYAADAFGAGITITKRGLVKWQKK